MTPFHALCHWSSCSRTDTSSFALNHVHERGSWCQNRLPRLLRSADRCGRPARLSAADGAGCGRSLGEMGFRARTGATVLSVVRGGDEIHGPGADLVLEPGDLLVVRGEHLQLDRARDLIAGTLDAAE